MAGMSYVLRRSAPVYVAAIVSLARAIVLSDERHYLFFFSSRSRHTRFKCDWSSDVCSSDLSVTKSRRTKAFAAAIRQIDDRCGRRKSPGRFWKQLALILGPYICQLKCRFAHKQFQLIDQETIPPAAFYFFPYDGEGLFRRESLAIGPVRSERVVDVGDLKDARGEWNLFALQAVRVPGAVLLFVVVANDRQHIAKGSKWGANSFTYDRVLLHDFSFFRSQRSRFEQDVLRHGQLTYIVHETASAESDAQVLGQSELVP